MAEYTYEDLKSKTVAELREVASGIDHPAVVGHSQMRKDDLIHALSEALGIEETVHHEVVGIDKRAIKSKIKELKQQRDAALEASDSAALKQARRKIHRLKRTMRRHMT